MLSHVVTERTRELGIRVALGAQTRDLLALVMGQGMLLTLVGLAIGSVAAFALTRLLERFLFGVSPTDPATFVVIPVLLTSVALLACWIPARRATRVNRLLVALRNE
jgi:ABC-type antimicrobial peptide transport system permease subunit